MSKFKGFGKLKKPKSDYEKAYDKKIVEVDDYIRSKFIARGENPDLGSWIFKGISRDCYEDWSEDRFFRWVAFGEHTFGFTMEHYRLVRQCMIEFGTSLHNANASSAN